ncbi:MAG TPA: hypothetical protein VHN99_12385 [Deinococcales bacterium]|nr:hypothetical protein [Deinococcales bacterium]
MDLAGVVVGAVGAVANAVDDFSPGHLADAKAKSDAALASVTVARTQADAQKAMALYGAIAVGALVVGAVVYKLVS